MGTRQSLQVKSKGLLLEMDSSDLLILMVVRFVMPVKSSVGVSEAGQRTPQQPLAQSHAMVGLGAPLNAVVIVAAFLSVQKQTIGELLCLVIANR